jgi:polysaccharide biosynthesis/export protein
MGRSFHGIRVAKIAPRVGGLFGVWLLAGCYPTIDPTSSAPAPSAVHEARGGTEVASSADRRLAEQVGGFVSAATPGNTAYKVGPQDVLEVIVFKVEDLSRTIQVSDSGTINLPLIGEVPASGRTAQELEREVATRLNARYVKNPTVNINVKEFNSQRVTVEGAVKLPGVFPIRGKMTLMQAIALAQGVNSDLASSSVMVFRTANGERVVGEFDADAIRAGSTADPLLMAGDVVIVPNSTGKVAFNYIAKLTPLLTMFRPTIF